MEVEGRLYDDEVIGDDPFAALSDALNEASKDSDEESEATHGSLTAATLAEQRAVIEALKKAQTEMQATSRADVAPVRDALTKILEGRKIQPEDPFWALIDVFALLFERFSDSTNRVVAGAVGVTAQRIKLDEQFLEYIPLLSDMIERSRASSETCAKEVEGMRDELRFHREELGQFISGVGSAFKEFSKASDRVVSSSEKVFLSQIAIPSVALLVGVVVGYLIHVR